MLRTLTLLYAILGLLFPALAQSGSLDPYFGDAGKVITDIDNWNATFSGMAVQPDGKIVVVGSVNGDFLVVRYHEDGRLDQTFGEGGKVTTDFNSYDDQANSVAIQHDGKIIVVGRAKNQQEFLNAAAARYLPDGTPDNTFGGDGKVILSSGSSIAGSVALQPDGSIIVGITADYWGANIPTVIKITPNGSADATFGQAGSLTAEIPSSGFSFLVLPDGKILMAGSVTDTSGQRSLVLTRYLPNGARDSSFAVNGSSILNYIGSTDFPLITRLRPDGKILVSTRQFEIKLIQFNADGSLDSSFGTNGIVYIPVFSIPNTELFILDLDIQADNKPIVTCYSSIEADRDTVGFSVFRFTQNGIPDSSFNQTGKLSKYFGTYTSIQGIMASVQPDNHIVIACTVNHRLELSRCDSAGVFDNAFSANVTIPILGGGNDRANAIAVLPNGKILVSGHSNNGYTKGIALARYSADGHPDTSFNHRGNIYINMGMNDINGNAMAVKTDGKIVIGAYQKNGIYMGKTVLLQFNADGTPDSTFSNDGKTNTLLGYWSFGEKTIAIQNDGKILLSGSSDIFNTGNANIAVARYHANGLLDSTFNYDGIVESDINGRYERAAAIALQADGKIVVAGYTDTSYVTNLDLILIRYDINGFPDSSFGVNGLVRTSTSPPEGGEHLGSLVIQPDGKILVVAQSYLNEPTEYKVVLLRHNTNGSIDSTFGNEGITSIPVSNYENSIALQEDGKILIVASSNHITLIRCNANGSVDSTFGENGFIVTPVGTSSEGTSIALQPDGRILVAGRADNGQDDDFVVLKYINELHIGVNDLSDVPDNNMLIYPNPVAETAVLKFDLSEPQEVMVSLFSADGKEAITFIHSTHFQKGNHQLELTFPESLVPGYYFLQLRSKQKIATVKVFKEN